MASTDLRQELDCSICLSIYTDPVTLTCGHNFCRICIDHVLGTQVESGTYTCPECRSHFKKRPQLIRNITLCNIVGRFLSTQPVQEDSVTFCTYCLDSPVPAAQFCLLCEAHLCDNHLKVHNKSGEHVLSDPTIALSHRICSIHKKMLEYYCTEDDACICVYCSAGEHRTHQVELLEEASNKKKEKLRDVLQKLCTKRAETEKRVQSLEKRMRVDQAKAAGVTNTVIALFRDIRRQLEDLEKRVLSEIDKQEQNISLSVSDLIHQLEKRKDELSSKMHHIDKLCNMSDPVTVLQESDKDDFCDIDDTKICHTQVLDRGYLDVGLISESLQTLSELISDINTRIYVQETTETLLDEATAGNIESDILSDINTTVNVPEASDILLDVTTAGNKIHISDDRKTASWSNIDQKRPVTSERFEFPLVISTRGFSSGKHYWIVDVSKSQRWGVGMCYPSIERKGHQAVIGYNNKSWSLCRYNNNKYVVVHDRKAIWLPENTHCDRVKIYLDYDEGHLSFYSLCDPIRHLHTVTAILTEPLHAALIVFDGCITISGVGE